LTKWKQIKIQGDGGGYKISWKKVKGANGYQVKINTKDDITMQSWSDGSWYKATKKTNYKLYFSSCYAIKVKVRAYKTVKEKTVYGKWSKSVSKVVG